MPAQAKTKFAPPFRSSHVQISAHNKTIATKKLYSEIVNALPDIVMVLNHNRQLIFCNTQLLEFLDVRFAEVIGRRPGEIFGCIHAAEEHAGCGTSLFCRQCTAVGAILRAQKGAASIEQCRITVRRKSGERALDLRVHAVPIRVLGRAFVVFTVVDIADEKRREILERVFLHDALNEMIILNEHVSAASRDGAIADKVLADKIKHTAYLVTEHLLEQRDLLDAEKGILIQQVTEFSVTTFLKTIKNNHSDVSLVRNKEIVVDAGSETSIRTDRLRLGRVLWNLIKNALEATQDSGRVTVSYTKEISGHCFRVHNQVGMPEAVRLQVFQRSFSTKGSGRGIGTYSVKLLTETYLHGTVTFTSTSKGGTTFTVRIPDLE